MSFRYLCLILGLLATNVGNAQTDSAPLDPSDTDVLAHVGHCGAVYGLSAAAATDKATKTSYRNQQRRMDDLVTAVLGSDASLIKAPALQSLTEMLKVARSKNEATGAAELLTQRQAFCAALQERLPK